MSDTIGSQAAVNALSGERTHMTIQLSVPATGDSETDFILSLYHLMDQFTGLQPAGFAAALRYASERVMRSDNYYPSGGRSNKGLSILREALLKQQLLKDPAQPTQPVAPNFPDYSWLGKVL